MGWGLENGMTAKLLEGELVCCEAGGEGFYSVR